jgi:ABC-type phosphate transport system substrate-binding protein
MKPYMEHRQEPRMIDQPLMRQRIAAVLLAAVAWLSPLTARAATPAPAHASDYVVVVSPKNPLVSLQQQQVAAIFLGQVARFPDGGEAQTLDLPLGSALRDSFYHKVAGKSPAMMKAHWTRMMFTGHGQPPRELADSIAVRRMVAENPAMIGYIDRHALDASVKAVQVLR